MLLSIHYIIFMYIYVNKYTLLLIYYQNDMVKYSRKTHAHIRPKNYRCILTREIWIYTPKKVWLGNRKCP